MKDEAGTVTDLGATGGGGSSTEAPWKGKIHTLWGDGNPNQQDVNWCFQNSAVSVAAPTPTAVTTTVGRLVSFRYEAPITVVALRYFGVAAVASVYRMAIFDGVSGSRVWTATISTTANSWTSITTGLGFTLDADIQYWFGLSAGAAGTTAGFRTPASPIANAFAATAPPGRLATHTTQFRQIALTSGNFPTTLPALAAGAYASAGTTGTVPIVFAEGA